MGEALFLGVGKEVLDKWLVSIIVLLLYLEYGVLLIKSLMERNFDGVTLVVTFDMSKSFTVLMFWFSWVSVVLLPICEPLLSMLWEELSEGVKLSAPFLVKCFSVVSSSISILSSVSIFITFAGMNLFGFLRHSSQHSFRKIIPCEISRFRKWLTLFPFKLSFWKSKNSTPFSRSSQVFPSNKKSAIGSRWDWYTHLLSLINLNVKKLFVF